MLLYVKGATVEQHPTDENSGHTSTDIEIEVEWDHEDRMKIFLYPRELTAFDKELLDILQYHPGAYALNKRFDALSFSIAARVAWITNPKVAMTTFLTTGQFRKVIETFDHCFPA